MDPRHRQGEIKGFEGSTPGNWQILHTGRETLEDVMDKQDVFSMSTF